MASLEYLQREIHFWKKSASENTGERKKKLITCRHIFKQNNAVFKYNFSFLFCQFCPWLPQMWFASAERK